jgi:hypothetical protein
MMKTPYTRTGPAFRDPLTPAQRAALKPAAALKTPGPGAVAAATSVAKPRGLGDLVEAAVKPVAKALGLSCLDANYHLRPGTPCAKRRDALNRKVPLKRAI